MSRPYGRRAVEAHLRELGASRREAVNVAAALPEPITERLAPWLRLAVRWHRWKAKVQVIAWSVGKWTR